MLDNRLIDRLTQSNGLVVLSPWARVILFSRILRSQRMAGTDNISLNEILISPETQCPERAKENSRCHQILDGLIALPRRVRKSAG